jgi:hypothetical protein
MGFGVLGITLMPPSGNAKAEQVCCPGGED